MLLNAHSFRRRLIANVDILFLSKAENLAGIVFLTDTAALEAAKGSALEPLAAMAIDPDVASLDFIANTQGRRDVIGPDVGAEAVLNTIDLRHHGFLIVPLENACLLYTSDAADDL